MSIEPQNHSDYRCTCRSILFQQTCRWFNCSDVVGWVTASWSIRLKAKSAERCRPLSAPTPGWRFHIGTGFWNMAEQLTFLYWALRPFFQSTPWRWWLPDSDCHDECFMISNLRRNSTERFSESRPNWLWHVPMTKKLFWCSSVRKPSLLTWSPSDSKTHWLEVENWTEKFPHPTYRTNHAQSLPASALHYLVPCITVTLSQSVTHSVTVTMNGS